MPTPECNIQLLERRVDTLSREVIEEIKLQRELLKKLTEDVTELKNNRLAVKSYIAGASTIIGFVGVAVGIIVSNLTGWKL